MQFFFVTNHQPDRWFWHPIESDQEENDNKSADKGEHGVIKNASEDKGDKNSNGEEQLEESTQRSFGRDFRNFRDVRGPKDAARSNASTNHKSGNVEEPYVFRDEDKTPGGQEWNRQQKKGLLSSHFVRHRSWTQSTDNGAHREQRADPGTLFLRDK